VIEAAANPPYAPQHPQTDTRGQSSGRSTSHEGTNTMNHVTAPAFLRRPAVLSLIGVSKATLYRWIEAGMFPQSIALTPTRSTVAWSAAAVHAWIADKLAANDGTFVGTSKVDGLKVA